MTTIPLGVGAYKRTFAGEPEIRLENRFVEKAPTNLREHTTLLGRAGTDTLSTFAGGRIRGTYSKAGLFNGDLFVVSGPNLWRYSSDGTRVQIPGVVSGSANPYVTWMKGLGYEYLFIADGTLFQYYPGFGPLLLVTGAGPSEVIKSLATVSGYVLASVGFTQKFYWLNPGTVVIDPLNFAEKESNPDNIVDMHTVGDFVLITGEASTENWYATGDFALPFAPVEGRVYRRGAIEGTPVVMKDSVILVGDDCVVYEIGYSSGAEAQWGVHRISDHGIEERIRTQVRRLQGLLP
jgi:hypothetical protein